MKRHLRKLSHALIAILVCSVILYFDPAGLIFNIPGILIVVAGTLAATMLGQSPSGVFDLLKQLPDKLRVQSEINEVDMALFVKVADFFRLGNIRYAELGARRITTPLLRSGAQMVLDRIPSADIQRTLQWKIGAQREKDHGEIQIFRTMMTLAPAFGMLGTLFGLISMLYGLDSRTMEHIGEAMGFAMLTTVYGLLAANLLLKPIIIRLETNSRKRLAWMVVQAEAVAMMEEKCHASVIQDSLLAFLDTPELGPGRGEIELTAVHTS
jgi:chemotaxis protein MotA